MVSPPLCVCLDIPAGLDEVPEDPTYLPIIGSGPASNPAASLPGPSAVATASEPKYALSLTFMLNWLSFLKLIFCSSELVW